MSDDFYNENDDYESYRERRQREREERIKNLLDRREAYNNRENNENFYSDRNYESQKQPEPKKKKGTGKKLLSLILCALIGFGGGFLGAKVFDENKPVEVREVPSNAPSISIKPTGEEGVVEAVAKKALPSVVGITTVETVEGFFGAQELQGVGSGIIVANDGYILTNSHVVGDGKASRIDVLLDDNSTVPARLLWNDASMDLAVIKVDKTGLVAAELGDSEKLNIGEKAIAIGNPLGLNFNRSVTAGYISGIGRTLTTRDGKAISNLIQTDAAINQGNSGGPLLNSKGQVIGINSAKIGGEGTEGLGFAIPINTAKEIVTSLIEKGDAKPIVLGIQIADYDYYKAYFRIKDKYTGVIILKIEPNTIAQKNGLMQNDVITKVGDKDIKNTDDLRTSLIKYKTGDTLNMTILRNGSENTIDIQL